MRIVLKIAALLTTACAVQATEPLHPTDGTLHHPAGLCVLGETAHVVSTNHDLRYRSGAVVSYAVSELIAADAPAPKSVANSERGLLPEGFGQVLNLAHCDPAAGRLVLLDRVDRQQLTLIAEADGSLRCPESGCQAKPLGGTDPDGQIEGIEDPGAAVASGEELLYSSRIDEQASHVKADGSIERVGPALASRPVLGGPWLLGRTTGSALQLSDGEVQTLKVEGWTGARWGVADGTGGGYGINRFGDLLFAFEQRGDTLVSRWHQPLRGHRRRLYRIGAELIAMGGTDRSVERHSIVDGSLLGVIRAVDLDEPEGATSLDEQHVLVSAFASHKLLVLSLADNSSRTVVAP